MVFTSLRRSLVYACLLAGTPSILAAETVWLDQLDLSTATQGFGSAGKNQSVDHHPLSIGGKSFTRGFGTHAKSSLHIKLEGQARRFTAKVGVDDEMKGKAASVEFLVIGDGKLLWSSGVMHAGDEAKDCSVSLEGVKLMELAVTDGEDGSNFDHADWADAMIEAASVATFATMAAPKPESYILTPPAPDTPRINGARIVGVRPGSPFLFTIPATGVRPMTFQAAGLPQGLKLDAQTGHITGTIAKEGTFNVTLRAKNARGTADKKLRIVCGDRIALTPPMGWNSWNCFAGAVSADKVMRAANAMISSGLVNHGWTYINVDDYWQNHRDSKDATLRGKFRDDQGYIVPNKRFPDMKALADDIHRLGLKAGLYSSPGPWTCGGCAGSYGYEMLDAMTYAKWGFDYLKYDWCSCGGVIEDPKKDAKDVPSFSKNGGEQLELAKKPYILMGDALRAQPRDIVFSLCQYGMSDVWNWGDSVGGNCWRTTDDITDTWASMKNIALAQDKAAAHAKPGNWNDPDMLILGTVGWGKPHPTRLTPDEQYLHFSLWSLFSAPLLIGCDMEKLDAFTLNLLTNDEVIAVNQDPLGKQATCAHTIGDVRIYVKELEDGSRAVGFCNFGSWATEISYKDFSKLGLAGKQQARDLWRQKNLGTIDTSTDAVPLTIPTHGVMLYQFSPVH